MEQGTFMDLIRSFFSFLDTIIYGLMGDAYNLIEEIANYKIFESVSFFTEKIYAVLSIFMLFKVSFSFVNYIVNPDSFTDKEKGVQNIIKNIVIMFVMLVLCPWAFNNLWELQTAILKDNVINHFIFGESSDELTTYSMVDRDSCEALGIPYQMSKADTNGDYIALMVLKGFYRPYTEDDIGYNLADPKYDTDSSDVMESLCKSCDGMHNCGKPSTYLVSEIYNADADVDGISLPFIDDDTDIYIMNYRWGISTAVGVVVLLILVGFAMDVGLRVVKLSFLELIAPIPIVSYIDPSSGKNGMFKKWLKEVGSTWASIFIRLLALAFAVRVIQEVGTLYNISDPDAKAGIWVQIFVIIGALMFAKQLPKLIQDITGLNLNGGFKLNPIKKFQDQALGGKQITKAVGAVGAAGAAGVGSAVSHAVARHKQKVKFNNEQEKLADLKLQRNQNRAGLESLRQRRSHLDDLMRTAATEEGKSWIRNQQAKVDAKIDVGEQKERELKEKVFNQAEKYQKTKQEYEDSRLHKNVVRGYAGEIAHGAVQGAKNGYKNPAHVVHNTAEAIKDSSELRNYREKYSIKDQLNDRITDVLGIKNESGTTSMVKKELKTKNDTLNEVNRSIELLNRSISQLAGEMGAEFQKAIKYLPNGRMEVDMSYSGPAAAKLPELQQVIASYYGRVDEKVRIEKAIKDLQDTADSVRPGGSGKPKK